MSTCFRNSIASHLKYCLLFLSFVSAEIVSAQFVITEFTDSGSIKKHPVATAEEECRYEKGDEVQINDFLQDDWYHVSTKTCNGYAASSHIRVTDQVRRGLDNLELKKKRQDSIEKADLAIYGYDINDPKEIKKNIVKYAADSFLTIWQDLQTKAKKKPKVGSRSKTLMLKNTDIAVLDFVDGFYKITANNVAYYISPKNFKEPDFDFSDKREYIFELRNVKESIAKEEEGRKYLEEQLKKEEYYISRWGRTVYDRVKEGYYWIGMTEEMAKVGGLYPGSINVNKMVTVYGTSERWDCRNGVKLYFETGILKAFEE